ncbi:yth domain-containing family protein 2 [Phtheirospermum japonicum]|uniref:YTH domain-containing family protein n=1 Tax=Phtheirospermum japonicum TaxID=374723 RepID=A0A830D6V4_9LAMI|nr:yth domain-containing family protein 2 [Phtheirospermum japonicum]
MSGEKIIEAPELIAPGTVSDSPLNLSEKDMGKEVNQSNSVSPMPAAADATTVAKEADQPSALEQGVYYPPTSYEYYYPGYNGTFTDDKGYYNAVGGPYTGNISDNNSPLYYYPGYGSYTTGYASTEYLQQPCSYGSDAFPCYSYDSTYSGNVSTGTAARPSSAKPVMGPSSSGKSNGYNNPKTNSSFSSKTATSPFNSRAQQPSSNFSKPVYQNQHMKPLNKLGSSFQTTGLMKGYQSSSKFTFTSRQPGYYAQYSPVTYQPNARASYNNNYRYKSRETSGRNPESEALTELTRGPRSDSSRNTSPKLAATETERAGLFIDPDRYNSKEFQTEYDDAKFYVIKSYSEDDVHKCIKYDVWSSTPNGNRKLDAAYREADAKTSETGEEKKCPVFLFFSVNGSGQFVGVAEMIGQVDFSKNMDFWQLDKWNGFFPLKWHIIKDVPNTLLRHIILENNENRPVTYSRDTQEIGLKQGLEMLGIFKNYSERTSVLDDFNFYENREKSFKVKRNAKSASQIDGSKNIGYKKHFEVGEGIAREQPVKTGQSDPSALISLTKNLSLNSQSLKSSI